MSDWSARIAVLFLAATLCLTPDLALAMSGQQSAAPTQQESAPPSSAAPTQAPATTPMPSQSQPTQPVTSENGTPAPQAASPQSLPDAPDAQATQQNPNDQTTQQPNEPEGTAAAESAKTKGGPASKPAGAAIAPAPQHRTRSLLIKLGVIAGAGAALGSVYALTRSSPARPPGAH